jgi:8-oxo-dGTP pyrophosphatase MutT (NUDIX family)
MNTIVHKVAAYITCNQLLLVFIEPDFPEAGVQVPSGTVDEDEPLEEAVLREAHEETGLSNLKIESFLGTRVYDMRPISGDDVTGDEVDIHRHYYHLSYPGPIDKNRWQNWEETPSGGETEPILFELYWVNFPDDIPELSGRLGDMLHKISTTT